MVGAVGLALSDEGTRPALCVVDEQSYVAHPSRFSYRKGKTPMMEFRVDDVRQWLDRRGSGGVTGSGGAIDGG